MSILYNYYRYDELTELECTGTYEYAFAWNWPTQISTSFKDLDSINFLIEDCWNEIKQNGKYTTYLIIKNNDNNLKLSFMLNGIRKTPQNYINFLYEIFLNGLEEIDGKYQEKLNENHKKSYKFS